MTVLQDPRAYEVLQRQVERDLPFLINKPAEEIKSIVIVGGYTGEEIPAFLNFPNAHIFVFEPMNSFYELERKFKDNPRVHLFKVAISDFVGNAKFYELNQPGCGSLLKFIANEKGHTFSISEEIEVKVRKLTDYFNGEIDFLQIDTQGNELNVLKGADLTKVKSLFLEVNTGEGCRPFDKESYQGNCLLKDLEEYLVDFELVYLGLDNEYNNGTGNSFWIKK